MGEGQQQQQQQPARDPSTLVTPEYHLGGGLVASGRTYQLRISPSDPDTCWPLFFTTTAEWPKITHMLPSPGLQCYMREKLSHWHHEVLLKKSSQRY